MEGAVKLIVEPIFEADFHESSFAYRPRRTAHQALDRVVHGLVQGLTRVIDVDLRSYFDNLRHHCGKSSEAGRGPGDTSSSQADTEGQRQPRRTPRWGALTVISQCVSE